jgi:selenide,water dikinase
VKEPSDPNVLVGHNAADDAAVYKLTDDIAIVETVDFFTPIVDDPFDFGRIGAANALSDVYAMGARPLFALNLVAYPKKMDLDVLGEILRGGQATADLAGIAVVGGHSIDDPEPKYGMAVTGIVHPDRVITNAGGQPGDVLVLTKPLGSGILTTALKRGVATEAQRVEVTELMAALNKAAGDAAAEVRAHAATDITGFGLLGHLLEMANASGVGAEIRASAVPVLPGVIEYAADGVYPGGSAGNLSYVSEWTTFADAVEEPTRLALADAQTSGGLLLAVPDEDLDVLLKALMDAGVETRAVVGRLTDTTGRIEVLA